MSSFEEWLTVPNPDCFQTITVPSATTLASIPTPDISTMNPKQLKQLYNGERAKVMISKNDGLVPVSEDYYSLAGLKAGSPAIKQAIKKSGLPDWKIECIVLPTNDIEAASEILKNLYQSINGGWRINMPRIFTNPISSYKAISDAAHHLRMKSHEVNKERRIRSMLFPNLSRTWLKVEPGDIECVYTRYEQGAEIRRDISRGVARALVVDRLSNRGEIRKVQDRIRAFNQDVLNGMAYWYERKKAGDKIEATYCSNCD